MELDFTKMHGLGNDFVVLDARQKAIDLSPDQARHIADRHFGIGCDQIMMITDPPAGADIGVTIFNSNGSESGACGNGSRCVADLVLAKDSGAQLAMATGGGLITAWRDQGMIAVDMGPALLEWQQIPLAEERDTLAVDLGIEGLPAAVMVNMGNPHAVHLVDDAEAMDLAALGPELEHHPLFPEKANIEFVSVTGPRQLRMRVWERGAGITIACGTGACAAAVAAARLGLTGREVEVVLDGGSLFITWQVDGRVIMRGPSTHVFTGKMQLPPMGQDQ